MGLPGHFIAILNSFFVQDSLETGSCHLATMFLPVMMLATTFVYHTMSCTCWYNKVSLNQSVVKGIEVGGKRVSYSVQTCFEEYYGQHGQVLCKK